MDVVQYQVEKTKKELRKLKLCLPGAGQITATINIAAQSAKTARKLRVIPANPQGKFKS